jgi:protein-disulfide isomerase
MAEAAADAASRQRRAVLFIALGAGLMGLWQGGPALRRLIPVSLDFAPLDDPPGFRRLGGGEVSGGFDPFVGIGRGTAPPVADEAALRADLCRALFGAAPPPPGRVPVASFSDYFCPFCKLLTRRLAALEVEGAVAVRWHEWPLLGEASETAARAALAADLQGAYARFHAAMMRSSFLPTPAVLEDFARRTDLDFGRLLGDMASPAVAARIAETRGLARLFGFPGTPSMVVGRTVVTGALDEGRLLALIAREREEGPPQVCR